LLEVTMARRRVVGTLAVLAGVTLSAGLSGRPARAAVAAPTDLPTSQFRLAAHYGMYRSLIAALHTRLGLARRTVAQVMNDANHNRAAITDPATRALPGFEGGFSFDRGDNGACRSFPQGITTTRDSSGASPGTYDGRQLIAVSWYTKNACGGGTGTADSWVSLVNWDSHFPSRYRKILLVRPGGTPRRPTLHDLPIHAGGAVWYGNYLYVAHAGLDVFDMRRIYRVPRGSRMHGFAYVLPEVARIGDVSTAKPKIAWSTISMDRQDRSLVVAEFTCRRACHGLAQVRSARAARFPFASGRTTFAARTRADEALALPWYDVNGVASFHRRWWFYTLGTLQYWARTGGVTTHQWVRHAESISYWGDRTGPDLLWTTTEAPGARNVFAVEQRDYRR
jgi:hypothetical protein